MPDLSTIPVGEQDYSTFKGEEAKRDNDLWAQHTVAIDEGHDWAAGVIAQDKAAEDAAKLQADAHRAATQAATQTYDAVSQQKPEADAWVAKVLGNDADDPIAKHFGDLGPDVVANMQRIRGLESGGRADAHKNDEIEDSRGPLQVNARAHPDLAAQYDLFDPDQNAQAARQVYDRQGYKAWLNSSKALGLLDDRGQGRAPGETPTGDDATSDLGSARRMDGSPRPEAIDQFGQGLPADEAAAFCGPSAAIAFANANGRYPTVAEAKQLAAGVGWNAQDGMGGVQREKALLDGMGVKSRLDTAPDFGHIAQDAASGNPVIVSTAQHYYYVNGYDPDTGKLRVMKTGTNRRGGAEWMSAQEISNLDGGINGALFVDNPNSDTPSVAGDTEGTQTGDAFTGVDRPLSTGVRDLVTGTGAGDLPQSSPVLDLPRRAAEGDLGAAAEMTAIPNRVAKGAALSAIGGPSLLEQQAEPQGPTGETLLEHSGMGPSPARTVIGRVIDAVVDWRNALLPAIGVGGTTAQMLGMPLGSAAGGYIGGEAGEKIGGEPGRAVGELVGGLTGGGLGSHSFSPDEIARSRRLGITVGDNPDPRDFSRWMEYKQGEAARLRARGIQPSGSNPGVGGSSRMSEYEKYLAEKEAASRSWLSGLKEDELAAIRESTEKQLADARAAMEGGDHSAAQDYGDLLDQQQGIEAEMADRQRQAAGDLRQGLRDVKQSRAWMPPGPPDGPDRSGATYVPADPFTIRIGKNASATAGDIRTELSGIRNAQVVRGNQLAEQIRSMAPDEQRALYWAHEAGNDPDVLKAWAADPNSKLDPYRTDIEKALDLSPSAQRALQLGEQYYTEMGQAGLDTGSIRNVLENYQSRIYKPEPPKDFVKNELASGIKQSTSHALQRVYDTGYDAVTAGKQFATTDYADVLGIHNEEMARVNANRQMAGAMQDAGIGAWTRRDKVPEGWTQVGTLEKNVPIKDANGEPVIGEDGNQLVSHSVFAAPDGIAKGLAAVADPNWLNKVDPLRKLAAFQGVVKTVDLSLSAFHHFTMGMQTIYQTLGQPSSLIQIAKDFPQMAEKLTSGPFRDFEQDFVRSGGMTAKVADNLDVLRSLRQGEDAMPILSKIASLPGVSQVAKASDASTDFLFGKVQRYLKVMDYQNKVTGWVAAHPDATDDALMAAKRGYAREVNAAYGGLNWEQMGVSKAGLSAMRLALLAPDWTMSNLNLGKYALQGGTQGDAARRHIAGALAAGTLLTQGVNYLLTGHSSLENAPGHETEVQIGPHAYMSFYRGGIGDLLKLGSMVADSGPGGVFRYAQGKESPMLRTATGLLANTDYAGRKIYSTGKGVIPDTVNTAKFAASSLAPVPLGLSNTVGYLETGQATPLGTLGVLTGIGRFSQGKEPGENARLPTYSGPPKPPAPPKAPASPRPVGSRR